MPVAHRSLVFTGLVYVSGYLFLIFVAVCLGARAAGRSGAARELTRRALPPFRAACGLYYLAELAEEYSSLRRRIMSLAIAVSGRAPLLAAR